LTKTAYNPFEEPNDLGENLSNSTLKNPTKLIAGL
jgi:hypothetical protein